MFFKNATLYKLQHPAKDLIDSLEEKLASARFVPCGKTDLKKCGFVPPVSTEDEGALTQTVMGITAVCYMIQEKILPSRVVNEAVDLRVAEIEKKEQIVVYGKQRRALKEEVIQDLLPRAFDRKTKVYAYFDARRDLFIVDTTSHGIAEAVCKELRGAIGSFPVTGLNVSTSPSASFSDWLRDSASMEGLSLGNYCELAEATTKGASTRYNNQDITNDEIITNLDSGKRAIGMELVWDEKVTFRVNTSLQLKSLRFNLELLADGDDGDGDENAASVFDANLIVMADALGNIYDSLGKLLGGWVIQESLPLQAGENTEGADMNLSVQPQVLPAIPCEAGAASEDPLLESAKQFVVSSGKATISAVQRHLKVGYNRAAVLIEALERLGVISPVGSRGARTVLVAG